MRCSHFHCQPLNEVCKGCILAPPLLVTQLHCLHLSFLGWALPSHQVLHHLSAVDSALLLHLNSTSFIHPSIQPNHLWVLCHPLFWSFVGNLSALYLLWFSSAQISEKLLNARATKANGGSATFWGNHVSESSTTGPCSPVCILSPVSL